ncbi:female protein-like isoform X2 [Narcine bancroftii]
MKLLLLTCAAALVSSLVGGEQREGLLEESLVFPENTQSDHVVVEPQMQTDLSDLTLCVRYNTELRTRHVLVSYKSQELALSRENDTTIKVSIGSKELLFRLPPSLWGWVHLCVTRAMKEQLVGLYVNGEPASRKVLEGSQPVTAGGKLILGHEEGVVGKEQNFVGELLDVNLWDRLLAPRTIRNLYRGDSSPQGNVIGWLTARVDTSGKVTAQKSTRTQ